MSTVGLGALTLTANSTLDFNLLGTGGVGTLTFAGFAPGTFTLNVLNWTGSGNFNTLTSGVDGMDDRLIFAGATAPNSLLITFNGGPSGVIPLDAGYFEVVPVPEPGTWAAGLLVVAALGFSQRKRLRNFGLLKAA